MPNPTLSEFLSSSSSCGDHSQYSYRTWLNTEISYLSAYVRSTHRIILGQRLSSFEIANISTTKPGKGAFTTFLSRVERQATEYGYDIIYIENVPSKRLTGFLLRHGYIILPRQNPTWDELLDKTLPVSLIKSLSDGELVQ